MKYLLPLTILLCCISVSYSYTIHLHSPGTVIINRSGCDVCGQTGKVEDPMCDGTGVEECSRCGGTGKIPQKTFTTNSNTGLILTNEIEVVCPKCNGSGTQECWFCHGTGYVDCYNCSGKGYYEYILSYYNEPVNYNSRDISGYKDMDWGMNRTQVSNTVKATNDYSFWNTARYVNHWGDFGRTGYLAGNYVKYFYIVNNKDQLYKVWIYFRRRGRAKIVSLYETMKELLTEKYGRPLREIYRQERGYHACWATPSMIIELRCDFTANLFGDILTMIYTKRTRQLNAHFNEELDFGNIPSGNPLDDL